MARTNIPGLGAVSVTTLLGKTCRFCLQSKILHG
jgi:hypothetical protein